MRSMYTVGKNKSAPLVFFLLTINVAFILMYSISGLVSYAYTLLLFSLINYFCDTNFRIRNYLYFQYYLLLALIFMTINFIQLPEYMGLSGPPGIGTDDVNYYAGVADSSVTYTVPRWDIAYENPYSKIIKIIYPLKIAHPVDTIIINILGVAFIPYLTNRIAFHFFKDNKVAEISERLCLLCPFIFSIGVIIMRDVVCTSLMLLAFHCFVLRRYVVLLLLVLLLGYLKLGFVVFLIVTITIFYINSQFSSDHYKISSKIKGRRLAKLGLYALVSLALLSVFIIPNIEVITDGRLETGSFFRTTLIDYLSDANDDSFLVKIYKLPILIRLPVLIITFIIIPPLTFNFYIDNIFVFRAFLQNFVTPIFWSFLFFYLFRFFFSYRWLVDKGKVLLWIIVFISLSLGMVSLQTRHKVVLIPFLYMAIAYSKVHLRGKNSMISRLTIALFVMFQFAMGFLR